MTEPTAEESRALLETLTGYSSGPWIQDKGDIAESDPTVVTISQRDAWELPDGWFGFARVFVQLEGWNEPEPSGVANARLIAASPDLAAHLAAALDREAALIADLDASRAEVDRLRSLSRSLQSALRYGEAALADIGDSEREPGDDLAWCEARAAKALPAIRAALTQEPGA